MRGELPSLTGMGSPYKAPGQAEIGIGITILLAEAAAELIVR